MWFNSSRRPNLRLVKPASSRGDQGGDEGEESVGSRDRVQQTKAYTVPKNVAQLETVDSEGDIQLAPSAQNKVLMCYAADAVW